MSEFMQLSNDVALDDPWPRTDLDVRDRSLVTSAALAAMGDHLDAHLSRGIEGGLHPRADCRGVDASRLLHRLAREDEAFTSVSKTLAK
jgi:alkylhydroperoxidase/carboxymuconolactone decarboxylase family protein YurZ